MLSPLLGYTAVVDLPARVRAVIIILVVLLGYSIVLAIRKRAGSLAKAPGPRGLPLLGSLPTIVAHAKAGSLHLLFEQWARQYGPIYQVKIGPVTQFNVNSDVAVKAVLDKGASTSAERPRWILSGEYICGNWNVLLLNGSTPLWKHQRKVTWSYVAAAPRADEGVPILEYENLRFLHEINTMAATSGYCAKKKLWDTMHRYIYSTFTTQFFGFDIPDSSHEAIHYIHETGTAQILGTIPGSNLVDIFPFLNLLPRCVNPWARAGSARFERDRAWAVEKMDRIQCTPDSEKTSILRESLLGRIVADDKHLGFESKAQGAYLCLMLTMGAADTSLISTWSFLEAMLTFPKVQKRAQKVIDEAVADRLPTWEDYDRIPYIRALVKETWRWRPPISLGHPHVNTQGITYEGIYIPPGSRIHVNAWAIHHDPARHADPNTFCPERYESDETSAGRSINIADATQRDHFAFGAGRRICPGYNVAERSLGIAIMRIIWALDVQPTPDAQYPLRAQDFMGPFPGLAGTKMPVQLVPRSPEKVKLVTKAWNAASTERPEVVSYP